MKEYIERDPLIEALDSLIGLAIICKGTDAKPDPLEMLSALREDVKTCSTADVRENVRGEWVSKEYMCGDPGVGIEDAWIDRLAEQSDYYAYCSVCGKNAGYNAEQSLILSDFCPNCGADMTKEATK